MSVPVIAIDGPSGTGKGTLARGIGAWLGWHLLDSGALYRVVAVCAEDRNIALEDAPAVAAVARALDLEFVEAADDTRVIVDGLDATARIRSEQAGTSASVVAALPEVRAALLERQHAFRRPPGLVADGRDMGTVVFPAAELKIFLTASADERARRRYKQLNEKGLSVNLATLLGDISARDRRDQERAISPLKPAPDAIVFDTTDCPIAAVVSRVKQLVREAGLA